MRYSLAFGLLLLAAPVAAEEMTTCGEYALKIDNITKDMNEQTAAGNKVGAAINRGVINLQVKHLREQCIDPYICDEAADQLNSGSLPPAYGNSFTGVLKYIQDTCSE